MKLTLKFIALLLLPLWMQAQDASQTIDGLITKLNKVNDYSVSAKIKSDIPLIKILTVNATIYFKQKDKFRIISKGIAVLPKQGFVDLGALFREKDHYMPILTGSDLIGTTKTEILTILPQSDTMDLILAKLWIDPLNNIVLKSQITTRSSGTLTAEYSYGKYMEFGLPDNIVFTVDVKKFKIPKGVATDINRTSNRDEKTPESKTGKIYINLTEYVINKGIKDELFKE